MWRGRSGGIREPGCPGVRLTSVKSLRRWWRYHRFLSRLIRQATAQGRMSGPEYDRLRQAAWLESWL